jgi:rubrerythrin
MSSKHPRLADTMELPPPTEQPNVYPLSWHSHTRKLEEVWDASVREVWDPKKLPWDTFDVERYSWEEREAIAYWWTILSVFDGSAPPVFAAAMIKTYESHEEDPVRRCFFSVTRDEQNHEQMCGLAITKLLGGSANLLEHKARTGLGKRAQRNAHWLYYNGGRYWNGYKQAVPKYSLAVLFSSFLMGEIAAATIFHQMAAGCTEPVFKEAFRNIGRDEGRHMAICMALMERDYPKLPKESAEVITRQIRAGYLFLSAVLFEPPPEFWDLPPDFIEVQRKCEAVSREVGFMIPDYEMKKENWRKAMLNLKGVLNRYNIAFPAIPEVGITGQEILDVDMKEIIPVF